LQLYLSETAQCLVHGLSQVFMKRGLPRALMTDNGAAMLAEETRNGLQRLAIEHKTTLPYLSKWQTGGLLGPVGKPFDGTIARDR
jgi:transposase InsO family protein